MRRNPSADAIEATIKTICRFWARRLEGAFHPECSACKSRLTPGQADRYEADMQYLWTFGGDPFGSAIDANIAARPSLYGVFDYQP
jgi:hypothetical protein